MPELAYVNGKIMPIDQAYVPIEDRGYQFGDAVYEFLASYDGRIFAMEDHLDRLERSLNALSFPPVDRGIVHDAVVEIHSLANYNRAGIYIQISRGVAPRNHAFPLETHPQVIITVRPVPTSTESLLKNGAKAITLTDIRWHRCDIKSVQLLPNAWAKQQALNAGADDAIFISKDGTVREATSSNIFIASNGALYTPPLSHHILPGITRATIINRCADHVVEIHEEDFGQSVMQSAQEVFLTGTVTEVLPVTQINGHAIGDGKPGPLALKLRGMLRSVACAI